MTKWVEIWFSILQGQSLHGASFTSVKLLRQHIDDFVEAYNTNPKPFARTKSEVHQKRLKPLFADQCFRVLGKPRVDLNLRLRPIDMLTLLYGGLENVLVE